MITAIDTNVLLDVFTDDRSFKRSSENALRESLRVGSVIACDVVWAEVAGFFPSAALAQTAMETLQLAFSPIDLSASLVAGLAWRAYRAKGGRRDRMIADFLIAAHALGYADRLLTRDRGFYRKYFSNLRVFDSSGPHPDSD